MRTNNCNLDIILPKIEIGARESKTALNFTGKNGGTPLPAAFCINLDWLSFSVECFLPEPDPNKTHYDFNNVVLVPKKTGTPVYLYGYNVLLHGEYVANLFTHTRNAKIIKPGTAKFEVLNHVLYSDTWMEVITECCHSVGIEVIKNISRMDIAIDGANHVPEFLNNYIRQGKKRSMPELMSLGKWSDNQRVRMLGKAKPDCKRFDKKTGNFTAFKIGSAAKCVAIYCKSNEINERSHKEYIRDAWKRAGMDTEREQWRVELRLNSVGVATIKDFKVSELIKPEYLLSIFKTQIKNFFEFVLFEKDSNVTRARHIDLFQFKLLKVSLLEKIPRMVVEGAYKAKMAIHDAFKNIMQKRYLCEEAIDNALNHIGHTINLYNLQRFYELKRPQWILEYQHLEREAVYEKS